MQRLEVSGAVRLIYRSLGVKGLKKKSSGCWSCEYVEVSVMAYTAFYPVSCSFIEKYHKDITFIMFVIPVVFNKLIRVQCTFLSNTTYFI